MELSDLARQVDLGLTELLLVVNAAELLGGRPRPTAGGDDRRRPSFPRRRHQRLEATAQHKRANVFVFNLVMDVDPILKPRVDEEAVLGQLALHFPHDVPSAFCDRHCLTLR
jgi:hypothetical protein